MIDAAPARAITIRSAGPTDQAYVGATMAEQLSRGGRNRQHDSNATVDRVLDADTTRVIVAVEDGRIIGWLAYAAIPRVRAVLFMYVRNKHRQQGVARRLVDAAWPKRTGAWIHGGLHGGSTKMLLERFATTEMPLEELL